MRVNFLLGFIFRRILRLPATPPTGVGMFGVAGHVRPFGARVLPELKLLQEAQPASDPSYSEESARAQRGATPKGQGSLQGAVVKSRSPRGRRLLEFFFPG